ncbi:hypothetical protein ILUMI_16973 [Ignelater luminosus]|uniref:DUF7083 domain-containing protein n=1 Tax=Ignelater luminosus TaxID=2038154 RepID=A0A8K0G2C2_IGNLU|nr:hypothetical protein ILUMI_16973 [Ignelater luminosus]
MDSDSSDMETCTPPEIIEDQRIRLLEQALSTPSVSSPAIPPPQPAHNAELIIEPIANSIQEFVYDPENGLTFDKWYARYEDIFTATGNQLDEHAKVRLLLRKLDQKSHSMSTTYCLKQQKTIIGNKQRNNCLQIKKKEHDDYVTYAGIVNRSCEDFQFTNLGAEQFKCLIFISGSHSHKDFDIRARLLQKLEGHSKKNPVTLHDLVNECQRIITLKMEAALVEQPVKTNVNKVEQKNQNHIKLQENNTTPNKPKYPCWNRGSMHFAKECKFLNRECQTCKRLDYKELQRKTLVTIHLKPGAKPVYVQKRPVSYAALPKIDEELQRLQKAGIIEPVEFSAWAAPIVVVKKPSGSIRICADYK